MEVGDQINKIEGEAINATDDCFLWQAGQGQHLVLYFYPKDDTPGCIQEGKDFQRYLAEFAKANTVVVGISKDSLKRHKNFAQKYGYTFPLIADTETTLCQRFSTIVEKSMFGKKYMGINRTTFLMTDQGVIDKKWEKVKVDDHVKEVLEAVQTL